MTCSSPKPHNGHQLTDARGEGGGFSVALARIGENMS